MRAPTTAERYDALSAETIAEIRKTLKAITVPVRADSTIKSAGFYFGNNGKLLMRLIAVDEAASNGFTEWPSARGTSNTTHNIQSTRIILGTSRKMRAIAEDKDNAAIAGDIKALLGQFAMANRAISLKLADLKFYRNQAKRQRNNAAAPLAAAA